MNPSLFYLNRDIRLVRIMVQIVDDLFMMSEQSDAELLIDCFNTKFSFGPVERGPGVLRFYGMTTLQNRRLLIN